MKRELCVLTTVHSIDITNLCCGLEVYPSTGSSARHCPLSLRSRYYRLDVAVGNPPADRAVAEDFVATFDNCRGGKMTAVDDVKSRLR
jgi:hypothetical protein